MIRTLVLTVIAMAWAAAWPADGASQIYVYAQRDTAARSWIAISCGNTLVAELKQGTYFVINKPPGQYLLFVENGVPVSIDTRSGGHSFIRLNWSYGVGRP